MRFSKIYVEIGNVCNLQCSFCPEVARPKYRLEEARLRSILVQVRPYTERVCFHLMGEPLAHPEFDRFVAIAQEVGTPLEITTNGTLLNEGVQAALLRPIVHQVNFSLQSFFDNFPDANPDKYLEKIFSFCRMAISSRPDLYLNLRLWNLSPGASEDRVNVLLLDRLEREFGVVLNRRVDSRLRKSKRITERLYLHYDTRFEWPSLEGPLLRTSGTCHGARSQIAIHAEGTVVPCCLDKEAGIPLGNIHEQPLEAILAGDRFQKIRTGFERGEIVESLCQRCSFAQRFPKV